MKKWQKVLVVIVVLVVAAGSYGWYLYTKKPADTREMKADYELQASQLVNEFRQNEAKAVERYVDKVLIVSGKIASIENNNDQTTIALDAGDPMSYVTCSFYRDESRLPGNLAAGSEIKVKGNCTGILTDVVLNKCSLAP